jgi:hypothetical protein
MNIDENELLHWLRADLVALGRAPPRPVARRRARRQISQASADQSDALLDPTLGTHSRRLAAILLLPKSLPNRIQHTYIGAGAALLRLFIAAARRSAHCGFRGPAGRLHRITRLLRTLIFCPSRSISASVWTLFRAPEGAPRSPCGMCLDDAYDDIDSLGLFCSRRRQHFIGLADAGRGAAMVGCAWLYSVIQTSRSACS